MLTRNQSVGISTSNLDTDPLRCLSCLLLSSFRLAAETSRLAACAPQSGKLAKEQNDLALWAANPPSQDYGAAGYLLAALAAATILSKRLSPRKESQHGLKRRSPYDGYVIEYPGIVATISSCSSARSRSPVHA